MARQNPMATDMRNMDGRTAALSALAIAMMVALVVAWRIDAVATTSPPESAFRLTIVGESGEPIVGASVDHAAGTITTGGDGTISLTLRSPELVVVTATGVLADAIVVGSPDEPEVTLQMLNDSGPNGARTVMHFAGDFMMGRRYVESDEGDPLVTDEATARSVVSDIAPLFALGDLSTVNFESVIGNLSSDDAYAGKRYLLQSPPETVAALDELGVDLVTLGNNHINDWLEAGMASTTRYLDDAGIRHVGSGSNATEAAQPAMVNAGQLLVGVVSMTTVTGDYVNDSLPDATAPEPATVQAQNHWQYEQREFGFGDEDDAAYVPTGERRPGTMWQLFDEMEAYLTPADAADLWLEVTRVYPELQDWVARKGHGGAAQYSRTAVEQAVAAARTAGADLVVVQLHGGFQFAEVSSDFFASATRAAVDAGADLVIGHHPHVLQGFEIYNDTLIAHSLGNFVFDQDFLSTHTSVVLRTVFEGTELISTTLYPIVIDDYRPVAAAGEVADQILTQMNEASLQSAVAIRLADLRIGSSPSEISATATVVNKDGRGSIVPATEPTTLVASLLADTPIALGSTTIRIDDATSGLLIGRDLFGYGDLDDLQADGIDEGAFEWSVPPDSLQIDPTSPEGPWTVRLDRTSQHLTTTIARTAARVSLATHRWFDSEGQPTDGAPTYMVRVWAKRIGAGIPFVRVFFYEFDDTDPTRAPDSTALESMDIALPLVNDGEWHELWVEIPEIPQNTNTALVGVGLAPPESQSGTVWFDGLEVIEWRSADKMPTGSWITADYIQSTIDLSVALTVPGQ